MKKKTDNVIKNGDDDMLIPVGYYLYTEDEDGAVPDSIGGRRRTVQIRKDTGDTIDVVISTGDADTILVPIDEKIVLPEGKTTLADAPFTWAKVSEYIKTDTINDEVVIFISLLTKRSRRIHE